MLEGLFLLLTVNPRVWRATAALPWRNALPTVQTGLTADGNMAGPSQPSLGTTADPRSHADPSIPAALWTQGFLTPGASPAGWADAARHSIHCCAVSSIPAPSITCHFVAVSTSISSLTSAFARPQTHPSVLTFGKTSGKLAGLALVAPGAKACVVPDAYASVLAPGLALRFGVEHEAQGHPSRSV